RNPVRIGELGYDEIQEFAREVGDYKPPNAAEWLRAYFERVKVIFAFHVLSGTEADHGWDALHALQSAIWQKSGGILQADGEGFSNTDGFHILWQFGESVSGEWQMAVMDRSSGWIPFQMDLGNRNQRDTFFKGEVPAGVKLLNV